MKRRRKQCVRCYRPISEGWKSLQECPHHEKFKPSGDSGCSYWKRSPYGVRAVENINVRHSRDYARAFHRTSKINVKLSPKINPQLMGEKENANNEKRD